MKDTRELESRFQKIAARLPEDLLGGEDEVLGRFDPSQPRLLGFYTAEGILAALEAYGVLDTLRSHHYTQFDVELDIQSLHHGMRLRGDGELLCDLRVHRARGASDPCIAAFQLDFLPDLLVVDWLHLQDPRRVFTPERPRLPGQIHPGSGVGLEIFLILTLCARRLNLHGLLEIPQHFHNAVLYQRTHFLDPTWEGTFLALTALLEQVPLAELSWALEAGNVLDEATGEVIRWQPREQLHPLDPRLGAYFELPAWRRERNAARQRCRPKIKASSQTGEAGPEG